MDLIGSVSWLYSSSVPTIFSTATTRPASQQHKHGRTLKPFDPLDHLQTEEDCRLTLTAAYVEDAGDGRLIASTLGDIVKAHAISQLARDAGLPRQTLHRALSGQDRPTQEMIRKVSRVLGLPVTPVLK